MLKQIVARTSRQLRHRMKTFLGTRPGLYFPIFRNREGYGDLLVSADTDICIEGFPRSANSFATGAFQYAQPESVHIAHHTHVAANAMRACELGVPTIVLIRNPVDAVISNVSLVKEVHVVEYGEMLEQTEMVGFSQQLSAWTAFYSALQPHKTKFIIAPFSVVTQDLNAVIHATNSRFGTSFVFFEHSKKQVATVHKEQGYHAGPSERRAAIKEKTRSNFEQTLNTESRLQNRVRKAKALYVSYLNDTDFNI